jgi:ligand-binding sensor domain-containing protein
LRIYNDDKDLFDPVIDNQGNLLSNDEIIGIDEDSTGKIWLVISYEGLFVYDPKTNNSRKVLSQTLDNSKEINSVFVDKDDNLWLGTKPDNWVDSLVFYDQKNNQISVLPLGINQQNPITSLLIDKENRLWISDYAYWKIGTEIPTEDYSGLNMIMRSPVFITEHYPMADYSLLRPTLIFEDSYGNIWYSSFGLVKLDPMTGEWCRVLDSDANTIGITQDNEGIYWTVVNGNIYSHK